MSTLKASAAAMLLAAMSAWPAPAAVYDRGDADADGAVNITDAIATLGFLFLGSPTALPCADAADVDDSGTANITDAVYLLAFLFQGGPAPPPPFGACGPDPTADALECAAFPACPQEPEVLAPPLLDPFPARAQSGATIVLAGAAAAGTTVEVAGGARPAVAAADAGGRFAVEVELLPNRLNRLFATTVGPTGRRSAPASAEVIHDAERPFVSIDEPREGERRTSDSLVITGRVSDRLTGALGLEVEIDGRPANVVLGIGTNGTYELQCPLALGENLFTVTARDFAGNEAEASVRVVREAAEGTERIIVESGGGQEAPIATLLAEPVVVQRLSAAGAPVAGAELTFDVVRSDGLLSAAADFQAAARSLRVRSGADGRARVRWRLGTDAGCGNNRLEVTAEGVSVRTVVCASARPGPAAQINVGSGNNQRVEAGAPAPQELEAWVSDSCNGIRGVQVTFTVTRGSGRVNGASSITVPTGETGHAAVDFVLGPEAGNQAVEADFEGNLGGPAVFTAFGVVRDEARPTSFHGLVLDNASQPIGGARCTLRLHDASILETSTDVEGQFRFDDLEAAGLADLFIDGLVATTAAGMPVEPGSFPFLHYEPVLVPNAENTLAGPVLLPRLDPRNAERYSTTEPTVLEIEGVEGLKMTIQPGSMRLPIGPDRREGTPAPDGTLVTLNQVHHDQVPMPLPDGAAPPFAWTLQPAGATFDPPITIEYPNMSGLAPGAVAYFLSFDHDTGKFEIVASGHVIEDGSTIVTDPGVGLRLAGWGCNCPPYSVTGACEERGCRTRAGHYRDHEQSIPDSNVRNLFAEALACVGEGLCDSLEAGRFSDPEWMLTLNRTLYERWRSRDALSHWRFLEWDCGLAETLLPDSVAQFVCFADFFIAHDVVDMRYALEVAGCGTDADWNEIGELIRSCSGSTIQGVAAFVGSRLNGVRLNCLLGLPLIAGGGHAAGAGLLHFLVRLPSGEPAGGASVLALEESTGSLSGWGTTGEDGRTSIQALPPGDYRVFAIGNGDGHAPWAQLHDPQPGLLIELNLQASESEILIGRSVYDSLVLSAGGQTSMISADGSFRVPNIPAPDLFGSGGPGTRPDFEGDDPVRVLGRAAIDGRTWYAWSEPFRIVQGQTAIVGELTVSEEPPPFPERIDIAPGAPTIEANETTQLTVTGTLGDFFGGATVDVTSRDRGTTYRTSSPGVATVDELGVLSAHAPGRAFITATNEGATAARRVDVVSDLVRVTVSGRLLLPGGAPAEGALVSGPRGQSTMAGADGRFALALSLGRKEMAELRMQLLLAGERYGAVVPLGVLEDGAALDLGDVTLEPGQDLVIDGFDPIGPNAQGYPEYCHLATGLVFVLLPGGAFLMGSPSDEPGRFSDEGPVHEVTLSPFLIAKYELTQEVWERVMGSNPSFFRGADLPVEQVSWNDAQAFCQAAGLQLPTEAQWEYAYRAGTRTAFYNGAITDSFGCSDPLLDPLLDLIGWYCGNAGSRTHPAGEKAPNAFGLFDMAGNVWEWCRDWYSATEYQSRAGGVVDPQGPATGSGRVLRGGSWVNIAGDCRASFRDRVDPALRDNSIGFRVSRTP